MTETNPPAAPFEHEVTDFVDHDGDPAVWSWECTCGANERGFVSRRDRNASTDRHLASLPGETVQAAVAAAQAPESPTDSTPKAGRGGSSEAETATGGRAPDVAALLRRLDEQEAQAERFGERGFAWLHTSEIRALLGTDTTPKAGDG